MSDGEELTFVRLTNKDIYQEVVGTKDLVRSMDGRLNSILAENNEIRSDLVVAVARVEKLETRFNGIVIGLGTGAVLGLAALFKGLIGG